MVDAEWASQARDFRTLLSQLVIVSRVALLLPPLTSSVRSSSSSCCFCCCCSLRLHCTLSLLASGAHPLRGRQLIMKGFPRFCVLLLSVHLHQDGSLQLLDEVKRAPRDDTPDAEEGFEWEEAGDGFDYGYSGEEEEEQEGLRGYAVFDDAAPKSDDRSGVPASLLLR